MTEKKQHKPVAVYISGNLRLEFDNELRSRISYIQNGSTETLGDFIASQTILTYGREITSFPFDEVKQQDICDEFGIGRKYDISGSADGIEKTVHICAYSKFPSTFFIDASFTNNGDKGIRIKNWTANRCAFRSDEAQAETLFWSFQGASYESRPDWILPLKNGFSRRNFMGMNSSDYGGGIPVTDIWNGRAGFAMGHCETRPELLSLPVEVSDSVAVTAITCDTDIILEPGETLNTVKTFVLLHEGDCFNALSVFGDIMICRGIRFAYLNKEAYEASWCAWGYERNFSLRQICDALPKVKELGFKWICLDDGWQSEEGDLTLDKTKFPGGDAEIRELVRRIHEQGLKIQLWWIPMACDPKSVFYAEHPDSIITDSEGKPFEVTWWDNYYLCPASDTVVEQTRSAVRKILGDWGFDGLKIDGQHLNAAPLCYNKAHYHESPKESYEAVPGFFKMIYEESKRINKDALIMFCPCGTCCSFYTLPYFDMPVASDPENSWQVRHRAKVYKALLGRDVPYNADHVELSDGGCDFASAVGTGSVINTKFTWPVGSGPASIFGHGKGFDLDMEKEAIFCKWLDIYRNKMLPAGEYLGELYSLGYDNPECHAIRKDGVMNYAFYAESYDGEVELKGLESGKYAVIDYVSGNELTRLEPGQCKIGIRFKKSALIEAKKI